ncbi:MAG: geranylgeranyl reductase family protein [Candidatus Thorarchaeota archaeon]|jgi:geranylgeranyl reductase family protein
MADYDVIIAGAGTAGTTTALTIAKRGHTVLLIDRKTKERIGDKTCGDALASHHPEKLKEMIGFPDIPENIVEHMIDGIDLISPDRKHRLRLDGPTIRGFSFNRLKLGQWLLSLAEKAGAEVLPSTRVRRLLLKEGKASGVQLKGEGENEDRNLTARIIVDASGASGMLRRQLPSSSPVDRVTEKYDMMVAWRTIFETPEHTFETPNLLEIYWNQNQTPGGYTWVFPQGHHRVNLGVGLMVLPGYRGPRNIFDSFVRTSWDFMKTNLVSIDSSGGISPMRRPIDTMVDDNFMLVGDAACQVNPVHGGGIGPSMLGGAHAGITASDALESNDTSIESLWPYNTRYMESYGVKQAALDIFKWYLLTVTNKEIDLAFRKGIIKGSDLLSVSITGQIKTGRTEKLKRMISGLGNVSFLKRISEVSRLMARMRMIYANYPDSPKYLEEWKSQLVPVYQAVKRV